MFQRNLKNKLFLGLNIFALALFFCLVFCLPPALAFQPAPRNITIKGKITNNANTVAISGAIIELYQNTASVATALADSTGNYKISYKISGTYTLKASATDYEPQEQVITVRTGRSYTYDFALKKITSQSPKIASINPADGTLFYEGDSVAISITGYLVGVQYQFSIDGVIKQSWSSSSTYNRVTNSQLFGKHKIKVEVKNSFGSAYKEAEVYILKKPISPPSI